MTQNVMVGYLHGAAVTAEFHHCLFQLFIHDTWGPQRVRRFAGQFSGANICKGRNQLVHDFLKDDRCDWLWMLDQDATFPPAMLDYLLAVADPLERPIIGALAHQYRGKTDENFEPICENGVQVREVLPTMYRTEWGPDGEWVGYREITRYELGLQQVDATGAHCLLVHRSVFEAIKSDHPYRWFREDEIAPDTIAGEDIWFCIEARKAGFPIFVDTRLESGHVKPVVLTSELSHVERIT
jgi:GT2 family glycosyltransferase